MKNYNTSRKVIRYTVLLGVNHIVSSVIKNNTPTKTIFGRALVFCGSVAMSSVIGTVITEKFDVQLNEAFAWWEKNVNN